uniref:Allatostatin-A receptor n=1 Tax=Carausius morosus TaxID=7022 RepID=A0A891XIG2_CARMO|nr:allatostatin-A receptor [Carausius morosus]
MEDVSAPRVAGAGISQLRYAYAQCSNLSNASGELPAICRNTTVAADDEDDAAQASQMITQIVAVVVPILFGLIVLIGLFGNALVVIVVSVNQQMRSTTNLLIINLALADLLFIVFCVPFTATDYMLPYWPFGDVWCKIVQYLIVVTAYASVYTLVLMSLDRFLAVVHPIASISVRTERNAVTAIGVTWVVILLSSVPVYLSHGVTNYIYLSSEHTACVFLDDYNKPVFQILFFATSYVIPLALICGLYLCMLMRLWRGVAPGGHVSAESRRGRKRVTRMVVVVVAIFAVCWFPIQMILVLKSVDRYEITNTSVMVQIVSHVLAYMNSCVNPILYAFLSENFRKAFRKVIYCAPGGGAGAARYQRAASATVHANGDTRVVGSKNTRTNGCSNDIL